MNLPNLISGIVGALGAAVLTVLGGFLGTVYLERRINKDDRKKLTREKIEKIYDLSNQLEFLFIQKAFDIMHMKPLEYQDKYVINDPFILKEDRIIAEMQMLAKLYINEIVNDIEEYKIGMNDIRIKIDAELEPKGRDIQKLAKDQNYLAVAKATNQSIESVNDKLRTRLSKVIDEK